MPQGKKVEQDSMDAAAAASDEEDQARMAAIAQGLQTRDAVRLYNWVTQRCFSDCVVSFYREALGNREAACVRACVRKYLLLSTASAARFADLADPSPSSSAAAFDD
ncbi:mitochondrial import inner membrane translocase subunit Tim9-like [Phragmites australis]|uniref:mitochondrial import inner membrane translocase subunit Tim9-like n=1 Tax=Phragmites australis TaxID=29695 RepID=UPI002D76C99A|nr:mitochondrial import inner membrane translocase subunit Tim9-like [Phragmites australis]